MISLGSFEGRLARSAVGVSYRQWFYLMPCLMAGQLSH
jgi:hypothetical protein